MNYKFKYRLQIVYGFIAIGLGLLFLFIALIAVNNRAFSGRINYYTILDNAEGLDKSPSIYFKGYVIGRVKSFDLTDDNTIKVLFYIYEEYHSKVLKYSILDRSINPISGEITKFELITPEKTNETKEVVSENDIIPFLGTPLAKEYIDKGKITLVKIGLEGIIFQVNQILTQFKEANTSQKIDTAIKKFAEELIPSFAATVRSYAAQDNLLEKIGGHKTAEILSNLNKMTLYLKETLEAIHATRKEMAPLIINANETMHGVQKTLEGINNNPLIKGGIKNNPTQFGVETHD